MVEIELPRDRPGLLVSVRSTEEAHAALAGGADVIDVKEPSRGSLGAADGGTTAAVVRAVAERAPVTAAGGELLDLWRAEDAQVGVDIPEGVALFKLGLAGCGVRGDWRGLWSQQVAALAGRARPVAVVYADWRRAAAPAPKQVLEAAEELGCPALLVDTWDKSAGTLFDHWPGDDLAAFLVRVRRRELIIVLAGSLSGNSLTKAIDLRPDLVAVRGAACLGSRTGTVSGHRVRDLKRAIAAHCRMPGVGIAVGGNLR